MRDSETTSNENTLEQTVQGTSLNKEAWRRLLKNKAAVVGLWVIVIYALTSFLAPFLPIYSYKLIIPDHKNFPPSLTKTAGEILYAKTEAKLQRIANRMGRTELNEREKARLAKLKSQIETETLMTDGKTTLKHQRQYIFGTDSLGRDLLTRVIYGGRISILVGVLGAFTAVFIGVLVGAVAGYAGGSVDNVIMRFVEIIYSLPFVLLVIIFMAMFGRSVFNIFFGIALISWLDPARIVRGQIISLKSADFVDAARSIGAGNGRIILKHMIPNVLGLIIVFVTLQVPVFIILESTLSFLGLGISPPLASWGTLLNEAVEGMTLFPWLLFFPSLAMVIFMFSINFLGDGLRDAFDPQSKNRL